MRKINKKIYEENIKIYKEYLVSKVSLNPSKKKTTYHTYKDSMNDFMQFLYMENPELYLLSENIIKNIMKYIEKYTLYCFENGNHKTTINGKYTAINSFYSWAVKREYIPFHPLRDKLERFGITDEDKVRESYFLSWKEIFTVSLTMKLKPEIYDIQSRILWEIFIDIGFRITAVQNLKLSQLDLENSMFKSVVEKRGKIRDLFFFPSTKKLILEWLEIRKKKKIGIDYFFITRYKNEWKQMSQTAIRRRVQKMGIIIGISKLYPHSLRKTSINQVYNLSDTKTASQFAGHNSEKVTEDHYIQHKSSLEQQQRIFIIRKNAGLI